MLAREQLQRGQDAAARRDLFGDGAHLILRLAQLPLALAQERRERRVNHLLVEKFSSEVLSAERVVTRRARQKVALQPLAESLQSHDRLIVRRVELCAPRCVQLAPARALEHLRHDALEKINAPHDLRDGRLGVDARRVI